MMMDLFLAVKRFVFWLPKTDLFRHYIRTVEMSSYHSAHDSASNSGHTASRRISAPFRPASRPNYGRRGPASWIEDEARARRAAADAHARAEEEFRKSTAFTENNYPSLVAGVGASSMTVFDKSFTAVTNATVEAEERERNRQIALQRAEARARHEISGIYVPRFRPSRFEKEVEEAPEPEFVPSKIDVDGFEVVKRKTRKPKRELTTAELNAKFAETASDSDAEGEDVNGELFERRRREEFY
jgi:hypothetical protein